MIWGGGGMIIMNKQQAVYETGTYSTSKSIPNTSTVFANTVGVGKM